MWLLSRLKNVWPFYLWRKSRLAKYRGRLNYALNRLKTPLHDDLAEEDRQYRIEIVRWIFAYYMDDADAVAEGPPEVKLAKTLRKRVNDVSARDHVYASVLYHWVEYKRIEGF